MSELVVVAIILLVFVVPPFIAWRHGRKPPAGTSRAQRVGIGRRTWFKPQNRRGLTLERHP